MSKIILTALMITICNAAPLEALQWDISSAAYLPNANFSSRLGLGLGLRSVLLTLPIDVELKGSYLGAGSASDLGAQIQVLPIECNLRWYPDEDLPILFGAGLNQSYWSASALSGVSFTSGLGYQFFCEAPVWSTPFADLAIRVGYQNASATITGSGSNSAANLDSIFLAATAALDFSPQSRPSLATDRTPEPVATLAMAETPSHRSDLPLPVVEEKPLVPPAAIKPAAIISLIIGQIPDQYPRGGKISLRAKSNESELKAVWVEYAGKPLANLTSKKTYFIKEMKLPKTLKGKVRLDFFARTINGKIISQSKVIEIASR